MRVVLPCGAEASVDESVSSETLYALNEMVLAVRKMFAEKRAQKIVQDFEIDCGSAEPEADR